MPRDIQPIRAIFALLRSGRAGPAHQYAAIVAVGIDHTAQPGPSRGSSFSPAPPTSASIARSRASASWERSWWRSTRRASAVQRDVGQRRPALSQPALMHRWRKPTDRHARLAHLGIIPTVILQPRHAQSRLDHRGLGAVLGAFDLANPELRRDQLGVAAREIGHISAHNFGCRARRACSGAVMMSSAQSIAVSAAFTSPRNAMALPIHSEPTRADTVT